MLINSLLLILVIYCILCLACIKFCILLVNTDIASLWLMVLTLMLPFSYVHSSHHQWPVQEVLLPMILKHQPPCFCHAKMPLESYFTRNQVFLLQELPIGPMLQPLLELHYPLFRIVLPAEQEGWD